MKFLPERDLPVCRDTVIFRENPYPKIVAVVVFLGLIAAVGKPWTLGEIPTAFFTIWTGIFLLFTLSFVRQIAIGFSRKNWILAMCSDGVFLKPHIRPAGSDDELVFIPYSEIDRVGLEKERVLTAKGDSETATTRLFLKVILSGDDVGKLRDVLSTEPEAELRFLNYMRGPEKLRIGWRTPTYGLRPGIRKALSLFQRYGVAVDDDERFNVDCR